MVQVGGRPLSAVTPEKKKKMMDEDVSRGGPMTKDDRDEQHAQQQQQQLVEPGEMSPDLTMECIVQVGRRVRVDKTAYVQQVYS